MVISPASRLYRQIFRRLAAQTNVVADNGLGRSSAPASHMAILLVLILQYGDRSSEDLLTCFKRRIQTSRSGCAPDAAFTLMPLDAAVLTVEFKTNLLAPAKGERFIFRAHVIKPGRTLTICEARALALEGSKEKLVATMTGTLMAVPGRQDIAH
ncbi:PaaI family thioesterase [Bradyrhizobium sp.]|uniref:PaaI family thioesterase n=1 Tax=Bradyrhizobium sp. TaxID=376 RepID=UPI003C55754B